jgi:GNAT superfamily N-acetyltransferase
VADLGTLEVSAATPPGVRIVPVRDAAGVEAMAGVHREVFGEVHPGTAEAVRTSWGTTPPPVEAVIAYAGDRAICAGRIEFPEGSEFATLWGGGTVAEWRGRGVFRALVGRRAAHARERGYRYLAVDAMAMSRPIFERLGFVALAETTPWHRPAP